MSRGHIVRAEIVLPRPRAEVFAFFADASNLERITPPDLRFTILRAPDAIVAGSLIDYRLRLDGIPFGWRTRITEWNPDTSFVDQQLRGPYRRWVHRHDFEAVQPNVTRIRDHVDLELPMGRIGDLAWPYVRRKLARIFTFRQRTVAASLAGVQDEPIHTSVWIDDELVALSS